MNQQGRLKNVFQTASIQTAFCMAGLVIKFKSGQGDEAADSIIGVEINTS
ncbi:hypothetical protein [Neisseria meningitidis]|nr:hypothetical protein [Neisseria meningitidis]